MKGHWETVTRIFEPNFFDCLYIWIIRSWYEGSSEEVVCLCLAGTVLLPALLCSAPPLVEALLLLCFSTPPLLLLWSWSLHLLLLSIAMCTALYSVFLLCTTSLSLFMACWSSNQRTGLSFSSFKCFSPWRLFYILHPISFSQFNAILFFWKLFMFCFKLQCNVQPQ